MANEKTTTEQTQDRTQSNDTVVVACKLPHGIELRAYVMDTAHEPVMGGGSREVKKARQLPETAIVIGNSNPEGGALRSRIEGGYALTYGIPKSLWEAWYKDNKDSPMVRNGLIFAHSSERSTIAESREKEAVKSGFERLNPSALPSGLKKADPVVA